MTINAVVNLVLFCACAVKGCKGCPPHARCIDKVCIINDDQPLAHILNALSGPEPGMHELWLRLTL